MRIAVLNLTAGGISGGYKKYLKAMLPRISGSSDVESVICISPKLLNIKLWFEQLNDILFEDCSPYRFWLPHHHELNCVLNRFSPDVIFIPMERYFKYRNVPVVNMVQNMLPMVTIKNNLRFERLRNSVQMLVTKEAVKRSDRVIAVSNFVREFLLREWAIPFEKVALVHHGVDFARSDGTVRPTTIPAEWRDGFLFTAGSIDPYRGLEDLLQAMGVLASQGVKVRIVIAGTNRPLMAGYRSWLEGLASSLNISSGICWAGHLNDDEMSWCYRNCSAFVMTSRVEACPNIALEAMSHGCVSICASNPPLPEFFSDCAIYYSRSEKDSLVEAIRKVVSLEEECRKNLSGRAIEQAAGFTWEETVQKTLAELRKAVVGKITKRSGLPL